jgi:hypothetical protein
VNDEDLSGNRWEPQAGDPTAQPAPPLDPGPRPAGRFTRGKGPLAGKRLGLAGAAAALLLGGAVGGYALAQAVEDSHADFPGGPGFEGDGAGDHPDFGRPHGGPSDDQPESPGSGTT